MSHKFLGGFDTYMGKHENNKTRVKFSWGNNTASNDSVMSSKLSGTATSNMYV